MIRTIALLLPLLTALLTTSNIANSAPIPSGEYLKFCSSCSVGDDELVCDCRDESGRVFEQYLDLSACDQGSIQFKNGFLFCNNSVLDEVPDSDSQKKPDRKPAPKPKPEPPKSPEKEIEPVPEESKPLLDASGMPIGDYKRYCNCWLEDDRLSCDCRAKSGKVKASIPLNRCKNEPVTYAKGSLICQSALSKVLNHGQCKQCQVVGNTLHCICPRTPCQWSREDIADGRRDRKTALKAARYCQKNINNCNGKLRCGKCGPFDYAEEYRRPYRGKQHYTTCPH